MLASLDESDIGRIANGQRVTFTVDAHPGRTFDGIVSQIRLQPQIVQNVVTYAVLIDAPEPRADAEARHDRQRDDRG